ncbi:MAG: putative beta-N-acetylglucosaminidase, partial [Armatimonadetes bacterium]|nr:putative beta-N-acetylglucosaminidase [Armatimonadota bacterium]
AVELVPFRAAIQAGAPAVMTTHIMFPELDPDLPATLSRRILTGLLREELGFDELVVTDCLEMKGIASHWGPEETALLAIEAGADMLLVCHTRETQARMHRALCDGVRSGRLSEERVRQSVARIQRARELTAGVRDRASDPARVSAESFVNQERRVADAALASLGDVPAGAAPFDRSQPVLVAGAPAPAARLAEALRARGFDATAGAAVAYCSRSAVQLVWAALPNDPYPGGCPPEAVREFLGSRPRAVVVAMQEPYLLAHYPPTAARIAAWGALPVHVEAVVRWLAGERTGPLKAVEGIDFD